MLTLAALCLANGLDLHTAAETELARIWTKVEAIRAKQAAKPKHSPLPEAASRSDAVEDIARRMAEFTGWSWDGKDLGRSPANHFYWRRLAQIAHTRCGAPAIAPDAQLEVLNDGA